MLITRQLRCLESVYFEHFLVFQRIQFICLHFDFKLFPSLSLSLRSFSLRDNSNFLIFIFSGSFDLWLSLVGDLWKYNYLILYYHLQPWMVVIEPEELSVDTFLLFIIVHTVKYQDFLSIQWSSLIRLMLDSLQCKCWLQDFILILNLELIVSVEVYRVTSKILVLSVVINVECVDHCSCEEDDFECC